VAAKSVSRRAISISASARRLRWGQTAQWTGAHKRYAFFAYADNYLIDLKAAIIVDVEATRSIRQAEVGAAPTMIERTEDRLGLCPAARFEALFSTREPTHACLFDLSEPLVPLHRDYDSLDVWGYARPILARALSVVNIHLMRAPAALRSRCHAAISRRSGFG
jgi:hypothetical protein